MAKAPARNSNKITRVAILGFGTVGSSVAQLLRAQRFAGIELTHIYNRGVERKRTGATAKGLGAGIVWTEDINDVLRSKVDVIIEAIGGIDPMEGWLKAALKSGKHVVTANKQLIAYKGAELARLARANNRVLVYNAAVAGGVPVIPATLHGLQGDRITRLSGILNGTCNFMLSHMEHGAEYADVLKQAQDAGYAEAGACSHADRH
jgi:homoserine dehydrogenase